jgi:hypothetical protein
MMLRQAAAVVVFALLCPGCAHDAEWMHRQPAIESTIGTDPSTVPAGTVYGPSGLGVDLTGRSPIVSNDQKA